ncbi:MAG: PaaI family thioesterase [Candidatus Melainabacteria bacterium HGW-Melainabacteria-1]|nr:MAG: PaaI family thioesterase [Candidatus Melainabacteria bacterium HGW-Melainabacteria-1]
MSFEVLNTVERAEMEQIWNANEILRIMGARVDLSDPDCLRVHIDPLVPTHRGGLGSDAVNGGVLSALCDMLVGLNGILYSHKHRTGTVQLNIQFLRPLRGERLLGEARATKVGRALIFTTAEIRDQIGTVCVRCEGIASVDTSKPPVENYMAL